MNEPFGALITSKLRIRILMRLFLNPATQAYLRELASEFGASPSQVKSELDNLSEVGLVTSVKVGRQVNYAANQTHSLFPELHSMVRKAVGMDRILESIVARLGSLQKALVVDDYALGKDSGIIDLVLVGDIHRDNLEDLVTKTERYIGRKIRTLVFSEEEFEQQQQLLSARPRLALWEAENRHA